MTEKQKWDEPIEWTDLTPKEVPVRIKNRDTGEMENYVLKAATAGEARAWRANTFQSVQTKDKGRGKKKETTSTFNHLIADSHIILVSICLHKVAQDGNKVRVPRETIMGFPNELVEKLFDRAMEISGLLDPEDDDDDTNSDKGEDDQNPTMSFGAE